LFDHLSIPTILVSYVALLFSLSVHEASHAGAAYRLGDDTAARMGRLTLNPLAHMDFFGTFLFPLVGMTTGLPMIGWAKPVPVSPPRFDRRWTMRGGYAVVAAAGPASNLVLSGVALLALCLSLRFTVPGEMHRWSLFVGALSGFEYLERLRVEPTTALFLALAGRLVLVNFGLAVFNLLPVGPLDGGGILRGFLRPRAAAWFDAHVQHMYAVLIVLVFIGGMKYIFGPVFMLFDTVLSWVAPTLLGV
jgi:Zn-dependent protease